MTEKRVKTGIKALDTMLDGGLHAGTICTVRGAPGTGKSSLGIEFISRGIEEFNESGMIVTFEYLPKQFYRDAAAIGFDLQKYERQGNLKMLFTSPQVFLSDMQNSGGKFDQLIIKHDIKRLLIDNITSLSSLTRNYLKLREIAYSLANGLTRYNTTPMIIEQNENDPPWNTACIDSPSSLLSYMSDTIIQLMYVASSGSVRKALTVLKHRASNHDKAIRTFDVTDHGISIEGP